MSRQERKRGEKREDRVEGKVERRKGGERR